VTGCRWKALTAAAAATARCCAITGVVMLVGEGELLVMELFAVMSPATALSHNVAARRIAARRWPLPQLPAPPADQSETRTDGPSQQNTQPYTPGLVAHRCRAVPRLAHQIPRVHAGSPNWRSLRRPAET
jgi:hypothetical protein